MKIKTNDAAKKLAIHPAHLLLHVAELEKSLTFNDVWPEIDEIWVETVSATGGHKQYIAQPEHIPSSPFISESRLSSDAIHALDKLSRQGKWGSASVPFDALQKITHIPGRDLEEAITELRKAGLLDHNGSGRGTISLAPGRRKEIEDITQQSL